MPTTIKVLNRGALNVACPVCFAKAGHSCFAVIGTSLVGAERKKPHPARTRAAKPKIVYRTTKRPLKPIPLEIRIGNELEALRDLRRSLCRYVNSDSRCDCKYLAPRHNTGQPYAPRSGEQTGCCEVREAIYRLEIVKAGFRLARENQGRQPA